MYGAYFRFRYYIGVWDIWFWRGAHALSCNGKNEISVVESAFWFGYWYFYHFSYGWSFGNFFFHNVWTSLSFWFGGIRPAVENKCMAFMGTLISRPSRAVAFRMRTAFCFAAFFKSYLFERVSF